MPADRPTLQFDAASEALLPADNLPPDLAELAGQLGDDAAFLAARYPAPFFDFGLAAKPCVAPPGGLSSRRFTHRIGLAAALLLAAVGSGLLATNFVADRPAAVEPAGRPVAGGTAVVTPVVSFELFTGAEQEAVLDLLEEEGVEQGSLSI